MIYYNLADQGFKSSNRASVGVYNVSLQLGARLSEAMPCTFLLNAEADLDEMAPSATKKIVEGAANGLRRAAWDQWGLFSAVDAVPPDWLFLPKGFSSFLRKPPCRLAVYIHDVVYSYWRRAYPGYRSPLLHKYFDWGLKASLRNADVVFTNSDFTAGELRRFADQHRLKRVAPIVTAGIGFDHLQSAPCDENKRGILAYVSSWPHKASASLLNKMVRWQQESGFSDPVYLLGSVPPEMTVPEFSNWEFMDTLPEAEYRALLGRVKCSIFNSEYEGFGMPPGESLMQGVAPVYSSIPALNEVMGGVGFAYDNLDYDSFARALNDGLDASSTQVAGWKNGFLERHNWSKVTRTIKQALA